MLIKSPVQSLVFVFLLTFYICVSFFVHTFLRKNTNVSHFSSRFIFCYRNYFEVLYGFAGLLLLLLFIFFCRLFDHRLESEDEPSIVLDDLRSSHSQLSISEAAMGHNRTDTHNKKDQPVKGKGDKKRLPRTSRTSSQIMGSASTNTFNIIPTEGMAESGMGPPMKLASYFLTIFTSFF